MVSTQVTVKRARSYTIESNTVNDIDETLQVEASKVK